MTPGVVPRSVGSRRGLRIVIAVLGVALLVVILAAPRVIGALLEIGVRSASGAGGRSAEVDHVSFTWPARLRVEGFRLRLAAGAEPVLAVRSAEARVAPLRWLRGDEFLQITLTEPRVVLTRQPDGSYDLIAQLRSNAPLEPEMEPLHPPPTDAAATFPDDSAEPDYDPAAAESGVAEADDAGSAERGEHPSIDGSLWTRIDDPFTAVHGALTIAGGALLIVDPAAGERTELRDVRLAVRVQTDEVITFDVSARQHGRAGGEGSISAKGRVAMAAGERFWYDPAATLRRVELDAEARVAPCSVGDVDLGGEMHATVHDAHATLTADGTLNRGTAAVRAEARAAPGSRVLTGDVNVDLKNVGLCPAFAPILAPLNPIFDVGTGRLAGRLDAAWTGGWSPSPTGKPRAWRHGEIAVKALHASGAPLGDALLRWLGDPGDEIAGDLVARDIRVENGRLSYDRMTLAGRDRDLTFAGTIAEDGVLRLTCEASARRSAMGSAEGGASVRVPIVGWVDEPRLRR